jgi:hypothetical protein
MDRRRTVQALAALAAPETKARLATLMAEVSPTTPEQFAVLV